MSDIHSFSFYPPLEQNFWGHIFCEIYKDRVYAPFLEGRKDLTTVDIGANVGLVSYYFAQFSKQVFSVEPAKEHFECLVKNTVGNGLTQVTPINNAIYMENAKLPLFHNQNKTMYSLHGAVADQSLTPEEVDAVTLDSLFSLYNIEHVDLMKLDVEGSEAEILGSEGFRMVAPKIDLLLMELHSWIGRNPNQVYEALKNNGFKVEPVPNDATLLIARR